MEVQPGADASLEIEPEPIEADAEVEEEVQEPESEAESPTAEEPDLEEKTDSFQERIDRLTRYRRDAERETEALRSDREREQQQLAELTAELQQLKQSQAPEKTLADFDYDEAKYTQHLRVAALEEAKAAAGDEAKRIVAEERQRIESERRGQEFNKRATSFAKDQSDYFELTQDRNLPITQHMAEVIQDSEIGPQVAYYLAKHPDEAFTISRSSPTMQGRMVGKLETKLAGEIAAKGKKVSDAPKPGSQKVKGVEAGFQTNPLDPKAADKMSDSDWLKRRNAQLAKKAG